MRATRRFLRNTVVAVRIPAFGVEANLPYGIRADVLQRGLVCGPEAAFPASRGTQSLWVTEQATAYRRRPRL